MEGRPEAGVLGSGVQRSGRLVPGARVHRELQQVIEQERGEGQGCFGGDPRAGSGVLVTRVTAAAVMKITTSPITQHGGCNVTHLLSLSQHQ